MIRTKNSRAGFTLIELLVTLSIIAMLVVLLVPSLGRMTGKANSTKCSANLRLVGVAVQLYAQDNQGYLPTIEPMPTNPVYGPGDKAGKLIDVLGPYGVTKASLQCPDDLRGPNYYKKEDTSYMWRPIVDDELASAPKLITRRGTIEPRLTHLALLADFTQVHHGHTNCLFADGHVRTF